MSAAELQGISHIVIAFGLLLITASIRGRLVAIGKQQALFELQLRATRDLMRHALQLQSYKRIDTSYGPILEPVRFANSTFTVDQSFAFVGLWPGECAPTSSTSLESADQQLNGPRS